MLYKKHKYDILVIFSVLALGVSLYLASSHYLKVAVPCGITQGCERVLSSRYSTLLGLPLSVWGVVYFFAAIMGSLLANHYARWRKIFTVFLALGFFMAFVFLSIQLFVIKNICQYCFTTDMLAIAIFLFDFNVNYEPGQG